MVGNLNYSQHTADDSLPWLWALSGGESKRISRLVSRSSRATWHAVSGLSPVIIASWEMKKKLILDIMFYQYFCHFHFPFISFFFISFYFNDATMLRAQLRENRSTKGIIDKSLRSNYLDQKNIHLLVHNALNGCWLVFSVRNRLNDQNVTELRQVLMSPPLNTSVLMLKSPLPRLKRTRLTRSVSVR